MAQGNGPQPFSFSSGRRSHLRKVVPDHVDEIERWIGLALWLRDKKDDAPEQVQQIRREIDSLRKAVQMAAERLNDLSPGALQALQRGGLDMDWFCATQELNRASELLTGRISDTKEKLRGRRGRPSKDWQSALFNGLASIWEGATGRDCRGADFRRFVDEVINLPELKSDLTRDVVESRLKIARKVRGKVKKHVTTG